jgi:alcohol dehydrogenase, propanol-preferring
MEMICRNATEAGLVVNGGYAERMLVKDRRYLAPLDGLDPVASAPLACGGLTAYRAVTHALDLLHAERAAAAGARDRRRRVSASSRSGTCGAHRCDRDRPRPRGRQAGVAVAIGAHEAIGPDADVDRAGRCRDRLHRRRGDLSPPATSSGGAGWSIVVGLAGGRIPFGFAAVPHEARFLTTVWGSRTQLDELLALARREPSIVQPVETLPLDQAQVAHDRLRAGDVRGRLVLVPPTQPVTTAQH